MSITPKSNPNPLAPLGVNGPQGVPRLENAGQGGLRLGSAPIQLPGQSPFAGGANQLDVLGAVLRRKFVVILAAIVGAGAGYLHFTKTPPRYKSEVKLQVTSQAPPQIVEGNFVSTKASMPRHQNLVTSEVVLTKAVAKGDLSKTELLLGVDSAVNTLKRAISVASLDKSEDTLLIGLTGPKADELPEILMQIVNAYTEILTEDNRAVDKEVTELIEKSYQQMTEEKELAESRYLELIKGIGADITGDDGQMRNPHAQRLSELMNEQKTAQDQLRKIMERIAFCAQSLEANDNTLIKVAAIEARKELGLNYDERRIGADSTRRVDNLTSDVRMIESRIDSLRNQLAEIRFEREDLAQSYGRGHSKMKVIDNRLAYYQQELAKAEQQKQQLLDAVKASEASQEEVINWTELEAQTERQWVQLYLASMDSSRGRLTANLQSLEENLTKVRDDAAKVSGDVAEIRVLQGQIDIKTKAIQETLTRLSEMNLLTNNYNVIKVRVLDNPGKGYQIEPVLYKSIGMGIFLAALAGVGLALLIDRADLSFHNPTEIFTKINVPVVGRIPRIKTPKTTKGKVLGVPTLVAANQPNSVGAEAFRAIRTALFFEMANQGIKTIMITSPSPGDGKSTVACNLAVSIAQTGKRVVLVDGDLRRPRVHTYFGMDNKVEGLMDVIKGQMMIEEAVRPTGQDNLFVLPCGTRPKNPGEVVTSPGFASVIEALKEDFDVVLLDSPPLIPVADPTAMSTLVDGVYMVFRIRRGVKITADRAKDNLARVNARLMGVIVNGLDENPHYNDYGGYYQYPYYSGYGRQYQEKIHEEYEK